jgi:hypothetical protein
MVFATVASLAFATPALAVDWNFYHHQSAPLFATSRGAKMLSEELERATNGELKARLHLSGTLQIAPNNITPAVAERRRATRRRPVQLRQHSRSPAFRACPAWCARSTNSRKPRMSCARTSKRPSPTRAS